MKMIKSGKLRVWLYFAAVLAVTGAGLWHRGDVLAGALESRDMWLLSNYGLLVFSIFLFLAVSGFLFFTGKAAAIENLYVLCALVLGVFYLFVLPPLSAPDEVSHYISSYRLSNILMGKEAADENGLVYIRSEDQFIEDMGKAAGEAGGEEEKERKVLGQTLTEETYRAIHERGIWEKGVSGRTLSGQWPVKTTALAYVPQAVGITIARLLHLGGIGLLYMGRLCNLIFFVLMGRIAVKLLPFGKLVLFGVTMLPMTLHLASSMSYDAMILALSFCVTALCLNLAYKAPKVKWNHVAALAAMMAVLAPCKIVYVVLAGFCLLIPVKKFGGWKGWLLSAFAVLAAIAISMILINGRTIAVYTSESANYVEWAQEAGYTFSQVMGSPRILLKMIYNSLAGQAEYYHLTMIGSYLGNVDPVLEVPYLIVAGLTCCLFLLALEKTDDKEGFTGFRRWWVLLVCAACFFAILLTMLVTWTPLSSKMIDGVQGRYFLPFLPMLLLAVRNRFLVITKNVDRGVLYAMCCANGYALIRLYATVCLRIGPV